MTASTRGAPGLAVECARLFADHPKLVAFPAAAFVGGVAAFLPLLQLVRHGTMYLAVALATALGADPFALLLPALYAMAGVFIAGFVAIVSACNAGLVHCTNQAIEGETVSLRAGTRAAVRALPTVLAYAAAAGAVGVVVAVAERYLDWVGRLVASVLGVTFVVLTFFVTPAAVVDDEGPAGAFRRSAAVAAGRFGPTAVLSLGVVRSGAMPFLVPFLLVEGAVIVVGATRGSAWLDAFFEQHVVVMGVVPALSVWAGVVAGFALAAVAKTVVYVSIRDDRETVPLVDAPSVEAAVGVREPATEG